jgi:hypothetical protein
MVAHVVDVEVAPPDRAPDIGGGTRNGYAGRNANYVRDVVTDDRDEIGTPAQFGEQVVAVVRDATWLRRHR